MDSDPGEPMEDVSTTSTKDRWAAGEESRLSKVSHDSGQEQDYRPCIQPFSICLHPSGSQSVVWEPLRVPGILSAGPRVQASFSNNSKMLFVFLLSLTHKCTVRTSKGFLGEEAIIP